MPRNKATPRKLVAVVYQMLEQGKTIFTNELTIYLKTNFTIQEIRRLDFWREFISLAKLDSKITITMTGKEAKFEWAIEGLAEAMTRYSTTFKEVKNWFGEKNDIQTLNKFLPFVKRFFGFEIPKEDIHPDVLYKYYSKFTNSGNGLSFFSSKASAENDISSLSVLYSTIINFFNHPGFNEIEFFVDDDGFIINLMPSFILQLYKKVKIKIWCINKGSHFSEKIKHLALYGCEIKQIDFETYITSFTSSEKKAIKNRSAIFFINRAGADIEDIKIITFYTNIFKSKDLFIGKIYDPGHDTTNVVKDAALNIHDKYTRYFHSLKPTALGKNIKVRLSVVSNETEISQFTDSFKARFFEYLKKRNKSFGENIEIKFEKIPLDKIKPRTEYFTKFKKDQNTYILEFQKEHNLKKDEDDNCLSFAPVKIDIENANAFYLNPPIIEINRQNGSLEIGEGHHRIYLILHEEKYKTAYKYVKVLTVNNIRITSKKANKITHYEWDKINLEDHKKDQWDGHRLVEGRYYEEGTHSLDKSHEALLNTKRKTKPK